MNIDDRIAALTMNLELMSRDREDDRQRREEDRKNLEEQGRQIQSVLRVVERLAQIAEIHERRLSGLEGLSPK